MGAAEQAMGGQYKILNEALAKQAAINDERFATSVKNVKVARKEAEEDVQSYRKDFAMELAAVVSKKKLEEFEQRQRAQALLAVKNCAGRRTMDADSTFEMGLGDALMHLVSGKRR